MRNILVTGCSSGIGYCVAKGLRERGYNVFVTARKPEDIARLEGEGFKVIELEPERQALQQIKDRGYADKYRALGQPIHLIGIEFSRDQRTLVGFEVETGPGPRTGD